MLYRILFTVSAASAISLFRREELCPQPAVTQTVTVPAAPSQGTVSADNDVNYPGSSGTYPNGGSILTLYETVTSISRETQFLTETRSGMPLPQVTVTFTAKIQPLPSDLGSAASSASSPDHPSITSTSHAADPPAVRPTIGTDASNSDDVLSMTGTTLLTSTSGTPHRWGMLQSLITGFVTRSSSPAGDPVPTSMPVDSSSMSSLVPSSVRQDVMQSSNDPALTGPSSAEHMYKTQAQPSETISSAITSAPLSGSDQESATDQVPSPTTSGASDSLPFGPDVTPGPDGGQYTQPTSTAEQPSSTGEQSNSIVDLSASASTVPGTESNGQFTDPSSGQSTGALSGIVCSTLYQTETTRTTITMLVSPRTSTMYLGGTPAATTVTTTSGMALESGFPQPDCFSSSDRMPNPAPGFKLGLSVDLILHSEPACDAASCADLCLLNSNCRSISLADGTCTLLSIEVDLSVVVSHGSPIDYWNRCSVDVNEKRQLGFLDPILEPITTALPLTQVQSFLAPVLTQLQPLTSVLSILDPLTTLAAVVSPVASAVDPILTAVDPLISPIVSVLGPVETALAPVISEATPAISGVISALLPAITPVPSLLDPLIPVESTVLSNLVSIVTNVVDPLATGLRPVVSGVVSVLNPVVSGVEPVVTAVANPLQSLVSGVASELTSVVLPVVTPLVGGVLSAATDVALPIVTPIICDLVASDIEHQGLGLNAGCIRSGAATAQATLDVSMTGNSTTTLYSTRTIQASELQSAVSSATPTTTTAPCTVTSILRKTETTYMYASSTATDLKTITSAGTAPVQTVFVTVTRSPLSSVSTSQ